MMALIRTCRSAARNGRPQFVPGSLACAASARHVFAPTTFHLSSTLKVVTGALTSPLNRLRPATA